MKKIAGVLFVAFLVLALASVVFVSADDNSSVGNATGNFSAKCGVLNNRIDVKINAFNNGQVRRVNSYNNVMNTLNRISARLTAGGVDASTINADLASLNTSVQKFDSDYALFIQDLENTKNFTCGHSQGEYVGALGIARDQMKVVNADAKEVKTAVEKVRADVEALRDVKLQNRINNQIGRIQNRTNNTVNAIDNRINRIENRTGNMSANASNRTAELERLRELAIERAANRTAALNAKANRS